jgi:hypothetical protein
MARKAENVDSRNYRRLKLALIQTPNLCEPLLTRYVLHFCMGMAGLTPTGARLQIGFLDAGYGQELVTVPWTQ